MKKPCPSCGRPICLDSARCRACNAKGFGKVNYARTKKRNYVRKTGYWGMRRYETINKLCDQQFGASHASTETIPQP